MLYGPRFPATQFPEKWWTVVAPPAGVMPVYPEIPRLDAIYPYT